MSDLEVNKEVIEFRKRLIEKINKEDSKNTELFIFLEYNLDAIKYYLRNDSNFIAYDSFIYILKSKDLIKDDNIKYINRYLFRKGIISKLYFAYIFLFFYLIFISYAIYNMYEYYLLKMENSLEAMSVTFYLLFFPSIIGYIFSYFLLIILINYFKIKFFISPKYTDINY